MKTKLLVGAVLALTLGCATTGASATASAQEPARASATLTSDGQTEQVAEGQPEQAAQGGEQQAAAAPDEAKKPAAAKADEVVCVMQHVTGQRYPKRICRTRAQMDRDREAAQNDVRRRSRGSEGASTN